MGNNSSTQLVQKIDSKNGILDEKKLKEVGEYILKEYPFLSSVHESMLLCDNQAPDCPIVYVNDQFERMTLYPREEILGRNCRFLQGEKSNPNTIKKIREAVRDGLPLDVEILNYRKDGIPFHNRFVMLPVHKSGKSSGKVLYFLAIQKDVTVMDKLGSNPLEWSPTEVAMYLDKIELRSCIKKFLSHNISGKELYGITVEQLRSMGFRKSERYMIYAKLSAFRVDPLNALKDIQPEEHHEYKPLDCEDAAQSISNPGVLAVWRNIKQKGEYRAVKIKFEGQVKMILFPMDSNVETIKKEIFTGIGAPAKLEFRDAEGDVYPIVTHDEWEIACELSPDEVVVLEASRLPVEIPKGHLVLLESSGCPSILFDSGGEIIFANQALAHIIGLTKSSLLGKKISNYIEFSTPNWKLLMDQGWKDCSLIHKDSHRVGYKFTGNKVQKFCYLVMFAPFSSALER